MGVALDSLFQVVTTAGAVAVIFLVLCLLTRIRREPGNRGVFQRMPVLLPAFAFVIAVLVIFQMGILPMSVYQGGNQTIHYGADTKDNMSFTVYPTEIAYVDTTRIELETNVGSEEYLLLQIEFIQNDSIVETLNLNLTDTSMQPELGFRKILD